MSRCRSCNAPIVWARTEAGKNMPLDVAPTINGNIELRSGIAHYVTPDHNAIGQRFTSHFATCEFAKAHRRTRVPKAAQ